MQGREQGGAAGLEGGEGAVDGLLGVEAGYVDEGAGGGVGDGARKVVDGGASQGVGDGTGEGVREGAFDGTYEGAGEVLQTARGGEEGGSSSWPPSWLSKGEGGGGEGRGGDI